MFSVSLWKPQMRTALMGLGALLISTSLGLADGSPEMARSAGNYLVSASQGLLESYFRDYPSTRFRKVYPHIYEAEPGKQFWYLYGEANAKNGVGGYTGWEPFLITPEDGNRVAIYHEANGPYDAATNTRMWVNLCGGDLSAKNTAYTAHDFGPEMTYRRKPAAH